jgi:hypothetical protein
MQLDYGLCILSKCPEWISLWSSWHMYVIFILSIAQLWSVYPACCYLSYRETPLVNCGPRSNFLYIAIIVLLLLTLFTFSHTITFYYSIRLILCLQQTGEIDNLIVSWGKALGCIVCRFHVAARWRSSYVNYAPVFSGAIVRSVAKLASITFGSLAFSYWFDKPWFHNWGKLTVVLLIPFSCGSQLGA